MAITNVKWTRQYIIYTYLYTLGSTHRNHKQYCHSDFSITDLIEEKIKCYRIKHCFFLRNLSMCPYSWTSGLFFDDEYY